MKNVWVIRFCEEPDMRVAASAEKAYEICDYYIRNAVSLKSLREVCLIELEEDYKRSPEWFACVGVCGAEMIEVEE